MDTTAAPSKSLSNERERVVPRRPNIAVIGLGVVGGSIARALCDGGYSIAGWDSDPQQCEKAAAHGIVAASTLYNAVRYADVVFCCGPVSQVGGIARGAVSHMARGGLVVDVCSTKEQPVRDMRAACGAAGRDDLVVIGTHPMAGSEKSGFEHSNAALFAGCTWVLTPEHDPAVDSWTHAWLDVLSGLLQELGAASVPTMDPQVHDRAVAACSHLVQAAATCVAATVGAAVLDDTTLPIFELAAGGFRDTTRIAESSAAMWLPILTGNAQNTIPLMRDLASRIAVLADAVEAGDLTGMEAAFQDGQAARAKWRTEQARKQ